MYGPKGVWVMSEWANKYGPLYKVHFLDECVLVCTDPETNARITRRTGAPTSCSCAPNQQAGTTSSALRSCAHNQQLVVYLLVVSATAQCTFVVPLILRLASRRSRQTVYTVLAVWDRNRLPPAHPPPFNTCACRSWSLHA
jgi:hypothetical protein